MGIQSETSAATDILSDTARFGNVISHCRACALTYKFGINCYILSDQYKSSSENNSRERERERES